jgi:hypothetical protein
MVLSPSLALRFLPEAQAPDGIHDLAIEPANRIQQGILPDVWRVDTTLAY